MDMRETIMRLMWEDIDGFFRELLLLSEEELKRNIISDDMKEWWQKLNAILKDWPYVPLPKDD